MKILVTGGAGFIGSVVAEQLVEQGHEVVVLDNLKHGFRAAVHPSARFVEGDILDEPLLQRLFREQEIEAVAHLAAEASIDDSMRDPGLFYRVNVCGGLNLLEAMIHAGVKRMVFSSTAAVYGNPQSVPIPEDAPKIPCNSYGESKLAFEQMLAWYRAVYGLQYVCLRDFNACGATQRCGESRKRETHLIPIALAAALGQREGLNLFGADYETPDGTCVRDYVHVADIARAHLWRWRRCPGSVPACIISAMARAIPTKKSSKRSKKRPAAISPCTTPPGGPAIPPCWWPTPRASATNWAGSPRFPACMT